MTGPHLWHGPVTAWRVARQSYGPLNPPDRPAQGPGSDPVGWGRYDTVGRTVYAAADTAGAFLEALSWARTQISATNRAIRKTAAWFGVTEQEAWRMVEDDWRRNGAMTPGWVPGVWRAGRRIYRLQFPAAWWVDMTHADTYRAVSDQLADRLDAAGRPDGVTFSDVTSEDRHLTTMIAAWARTTVTGPDGAPTAGIRYQSKNGRAGNGDGICYAYWLPATPAARPTVHADQGAVIPADDPDLHTATQALGIHTR